jgi:transposase
MWLFRRQAPDFKTIADFRKDNHSAIRQVCHEFTLFCRELNLFGGELVAAWNTLSKRANLPRMNCWSRSVI